MAPSMAERSSARRGPGPAPVRADGRGRPGGRRARRRRRQPRLGRARCHRRHRLHRHRPHRGGRRGHQRPAGHRPGPGRAGLLGRAAGHPGPVPRRGGLALRGRRHRHPRRCLRRVARRAPASLTDALECYGAVGVDTHRTSWPWLGLLAGLLATGAAAVATVDAHAWPEMGTRYDAPVATGPGAAAPEGARAPRHARRRTTTPRTSTSGAPWTTATTRRSDDTARGL